MFQIKNEDERARVRGIQPETVLAICIAYSVYQDNGRKDMVVTSIAELSESHRKDSDHYKGFAFGLRTRDLSPELQNKITIQLTEALGDDYVVILESNHIHVGFKPRV